MAKSGLLTRVMTALVILPIALALIWTPVLSIGFVIFAVVLTSLAAYEYFRLATLLKFPMEPNVGMVASVLVIASAGFGRPQFVQIALVGGIALVSFWQVWKGRLSVAGVAISVFGVVYTGWFPAHIILVHSVESSGPAYVTLLILAMVATDTGAYFIGRAFGQRKLAPVISPNKTWEGALGGFAVSVGAFALMPLVRDRFPILELPPWTIGEYLAVAAVLSLAAQIGDLLESSIKRDAGVKDSGTAFPGHGGALDRFDGFLFAGPVLYYIVTF